MEADMEISLSISKNCHKHFSAERQIINIKMADVIYKYTTDYSIEDCMGILARKNIYDVFEYSYEKKTDNAIEIIIKECNTHLCNNPRTCYEITFEKEVKTIIKVIFISEWYILKVPIIPKKWMDEFMKQKLDADLID